MAKEIIGGNFHNENSGSTSYVDVDPIDMSEGMQEAMHRSNLDMRCVCVFIYAYMLKLRYAGLDCGSMHLSLASCFPAGYFSLSSLSFPTFPCFSNSI